MKHYCNNCGAELENKDFCPKCNKKTNVGKMEERKKANNSLFNKLAKFFLIYIGVIIIISIILSIFNINPLDISYVYTIMFWGSVIYIIIKNKKTK